jgi:hypothetical protein
MHPPEAQLRYEDRARLRMQARRCLANADGQVVGKTNRKSHGRLPTVA